MVVGVVGAMVDEIDYLLNSLENVKEEQKFGMLVYGSEINGNEVYIVECGVGKVNASMAVALLVMEYGAELIINSGIAGATAPLKTRDIIIGKEISYNDVDVTAFGYEFGQIPGLPKKFTPNIEDVLLVKKALNKLGLEYKERNIYSGDQFVSSFDQLKNINDEGFLCEMEGASVAHTATKLGVGFIILRFISDIIGHPSQIADYQAFEHDMAVTSAKICLNVLHNLD